MKLLLSLILSFVASSSSAQSVGVMQGSYRDISRKSLSYTGAALYTSRKLEDVQSERYFELVPEIGVAQFRDGTSGSTLSQVYFTPTLRYWIGAFSIEAGIGLSWLSDRQLGTKTLSTSFQFADHLGIAYRIGKHYLICYRITHTSNADIRKPNPGIDAQQLYLSFLF
jgi:lipid A 3-O-deacylase